MSNAVAPADRGKKLHVPKVPAALRKKLVADVTRKGTNINDVAVGILARKLGVDYAGGSGRRSLARITEGARPLVLEMPSALHRAISQRALDTGSNRAAVVVATLCDHYRIPKRDRS